MHAELNVYCHYKALTDELIREQAELIDSELAKQKKRNVLRFKHIENLQQERIDLMAELTTDLGK